MIERTNWTGGTRECGFDIRVDRSKRILRFTFSGFWDLDLGVAFRDAAITALKQVARSGEAWGVLADLSKYPPQKPEVQQCHSAAMAVSSRLGVRASANLVDNTLSQMQIRRLSQESGLPVFSFFQSEFEAMSWLEQSLATT